MGCVLLLVVIFVTQTINYARGAEFGFVDGSPGPDFSGPYREAAILTWIPAAVPVIAFAAAIVLLLWRDLPHLPLTLGAAAMATVASGCQLALALRQVGEDNSVVPLAFPWTLVPQWASTFAVVSVAVSAFLAVTLVGLLLRAAWPGRRSPIPLRWWWFALAAIAALVAAGQWSWWADRLAERVTLQEASGFGRFGGESFATVAQTEALNYSSRLSWYLTGSMAIVGLALALSWLWFSAAVRPGSAFVPRNHGAMALIVVMFALFCGTDGDVLLGIPVPLTFALLLGLLLTVLVVRRRSLRELRTASRTLTEEARVQLLLQLDRGRTLDREDQKSYDERTAGELGASDYQRQYALRSRIRRTLAARRSRPTAGWAPKTLALTLGPEVSWWGNGMAAVRVGAVLAVLPVTQITLVSLESFDWFSLTPGAPYGQRSWPSSS